MGKVMPEYRVWKKGDYYNSIFADDVIISPDKKTAKIIIAHSHEIVTKPLEELKDVEHYKDDSFAWKFGESYHGADYDKPYLWIKAKDIKKE
jgi:hypothetical protein